ncbi:MAG: mechanosensitive ion channel family protein [Candidatus Thermoplasmatota archaeon]|nr:mechanosensitive ion channel family protein [Candidatus Thermoplasmatota archaeon]
MTNATADNSWTTDVVEAMPDWESEILGFNQGTLLVLTGLLIFVGITRQLALLVIPRAFKTLCEKSPVADIAIRGSSTALGTAIGAGILSMVSVDLIASDSSLMPNFVETWLPSIAKVVMLIAIIMWALRLTGIVQSVVEFWDDDGELDGSERTLISAVESVMRFCIVVFGSIFVADALHFDLTTMVAGLGITGLALALAAKDSIANIFGAVTVLLDRPFRVGDWIDVGGSQGEVIMISLRTTLIRTSIDTIITIPNASLTNKSIENYGKRRWRRFTPIISLDLDSEPDSVETFCKEVEELIREDENTMKKDDSWAKVSSISKDSIEVSCNIYWDVEGGADERDARQGWLLNVARIAKKNKIEFYEPRIRNQRQLN